ncbi:MAG: hypothetical protein ACTSVI_16020 [Promethearchaeota archaeon]
MTTINQIQIQIQCPSCKKSQWIKLSDDTFKNQEGIATVAINAACGHSFHVFIDSSFKIRGYHRADLVIISEMVKIDKEISLMLKDEGIEIDDEKPLKNFYNDSIFSPSIKNLMESFDNSNLYSEIKILNIKPQKIDGNGSTSSIKELKSIVDEDETEKLKMLKRQYGVRIKKLEDAIIKLEIHMKKNQGKIPREELEFKSRKLKHLKKKLKDTFKELYDYE